MVELDAGVEHGDDVRAPRSLEPRLADAHAIERVLVAGLRVVDADGRPASSASWTTVVRLGGHDRRVGAQLGERARRPTGPRWRPPPARPALAGPSSVDDAHPERAGRVVARDTLAELDDDLAGDDRRPSREPARRLRLGGADRDRRGDEEQECEAVERARDKTRGLRCGSLGRCRRPDECGP